MHELSIAQNIIDTLYEEQNHHGFSKVTNIRLRVGKFSNIVPDTLRFCFDVLRENTIADDAVLAMEIAELKAKCDNCSLEFVIDDIVFLCPDCGNPSIGVQTGGELDIIAIEVE